MTENHLRQAYSTAFGKLINVARRHRRLVRARRLREDHVMDMLADLCEFALVSRALTEFGVEPPAPLRADQRALRDAALRLAQTMMRGDLNRPELKQAHCDFDAAVERLK
jgi:hypothetical protein